ncbi:MAG: hypothetical protein Q9225_006907, partial [Loekoesia sp. 1 TL-2023]
MDPTQDDSLIRLLETYQERLRLDQALVRRGLSPRYYNPAELAQLQQICAQVQQSSSAMPHSKQTEASPEQLSNDGFIQKLAAFHGERGTTLDPSPRVNGKPIDLQKLYQIVLNLGGYDQVSREKLAWRKVGQEFHLGATNAAAYAFALKTAYYKNLAAFEIKDHHNKTPPPREILEDVTAKGGDLLSRTLGNYRQPTVEEAEASGEEEVKTPEGGDKMDLDEPGSGTGRSTR